jgi:Raf kinase inhibitor-like YbhB/YbcL family protein
VLIIIIFLKKKMILIKGFILIIAFLFISIQISPQTKSSKSKMDIKIKSSAFKDGGLIPSKFSCEDENVSPQLHWNEVSKDIKSYAIILDDPDAPGGNFVHWVIFNIPGTMKELHENVTPSRNIPDEVMLGTNSFGRIGYGGPCPPPGKAHHYYFRIYGLDTILHHVESGSTKQQLVSAMEGHILATGEIMGTFKRSKQ